MRSPRPFWIMGLLLLSGASLLQTQPAAAQDGGQNLPPPPENPQVDETGVNVTTGAVSYDKILLSIGPSQPMGLAYSLRPDGRSNLYGIFNYNYASDYSAHVSFDSLGANMFDGVMYTADGPWAGATTGGLVMIDTAGNTYQYNTSLMYGSDPNCNCALIVAAVSEIDFANGATWDFHYRIGDPNNGQATLRLQSVVSNTGYELKFEYSSDTYDPAAPSNFLHMTKVTAINNVVDYCDPDADHCTLTGSWSSISSPSTGGIQDPNGGTWGFQGFYWNALQTSITPPLSSTPTISYQLAGNSGGGQIWPDARVSSATVEGVSATYSYQDISEQIWRVTRTSSTGTRTYESRIKPPRTGESTLVPWYYEIRPGVTKLVDELGRTSLFQYDDGDRLTKATYPEGNSVEYIPGAPRPTQIIYHAKDGATTTVNQVFPACANGYPDKICFKPTSVTDPRGNTTTFTYAPEHGGILTKISPADANGINPETRYSYSQHYAWYKNSTGAVVQAATPVWLLDSERTCMTTATVNDACTGGSSDEVVTSYDYGPGDASHPNNLLLRGVAVTPGGQTRRTCYTYDMKGNKISETSPNAGLASCS